MLNYLHAYRLNNHPTATQEVSTTRWFLLGRTDIIRSCTKAALTFVKTMVDPTATVSKVTYTVCGRNRYNSSEISFQYNWQSNYAVHAYTCQCMQNQSCTYMTLCKLFSLTGRKKGQGYGSGCQSAF